MSVNRWRMVALIATISTGYYPMAVNVVRRGFPPAHGQSPYCYEAECAVGCRVNGRLTTTAHNAAAGNGESRRRLVPVAALRRHHLFRPRASQRPWQRL